jgi:shikimate kinase
MENSPPTARHRPNLYLIGFMGVGKSAVGRNVSRALGMPFLDSDWAIESKAGKPITRIFAEDGEPAFRALERQFIDGGHPPHGVVVACGGGLPVQPGMREQLLAKGVVICLFANPETIIGRTAGNHRRPLLHGENPADRVRKLLAEREPLYLNTGIGISTEGRSLNEVVQNVVRVYRREARDR